MVTLHKQGERSKEKTLVIMMLSGTRPALFTQVQHVT